MLTANVIKHFGSQVAVARALKIKAPSVADWGRHVPPLRQLQIEKLTGGKLRADRAILPDGPSEAQIA
jgi:transcriptional repressor of cell division inhibition gene dicB